MKAILLRETGSFDMLGYEAVPDPVPGRDQVRIRTHAVSINFADTQVRRGTYPAALSPKLPAVPGLGMLALGEIAPVIHARVPLAEAGRAHAMLEGRGTIGKVLLKPEAARADLHLTCT